MMGGSTVFALSICALGLGLLFGVIGIATPYWLDASDSRFRFDTHSGLWQFCINGRCKRIPAGSADKKFEASRAFAVLGLLAGIGATTCLLLGQYTYRDKRSQLRLAALSTAIATVLCLIINIATYVDRLPSQARDYLAWSFALTATALGVFGVATALTAGLVLLDRQADYIRT